MDNTKGDVDGIVAKLNKIHIKCPYERVNTVEGI